MSLHDDMLKMGDQAVAAARLLNQLSSRRKNAILQAMSDELEARREVIKAANALDMEAGRQAGLSDALLDRLQLTDARIDAMAKGVRDIVGLKDPVGIKISRWIRPNGLVIQKVRVPIGVIAIIYESRPNVTSDAAALCFKTSNAVILRGGSEAMHSNRAIAEALQAGGEAKGLPPYSIQLIATTDREAVRELVQLEGKVDLAIPRGGEGLIRTVTDMARVPVIKHYKGNCHVYVDESANLEMALKIVENAKCQRPGVCNAMETLLVHEKIAPIFLPAIAAKLTAKGVELRGDELSRQYVPSMKAATEEDWYTEYLDLILAVKVVSDTQAAIDHINKYGSHHSDAIVAELEAPQKLFSQQVDSAAVYVNASTRFTDGAEFGMGAEIGISTDKIHARGPMALEELTTYKYVVLGTGQVRS
ncbi:MAG TPA: glutamate-5-semialdehyde dehydrogenase [Verrucomicrobia bacterium]|nr:MAG: glutamate-5-semialdehyde dehydrogenase [Lentisphaerae bacterium GWF2_57_35]HBA84628.1 glutamate-5-semialdehyde dehydrogenase [Verrucomicrobiota bacterium]